jgi:hypothetical protein
VGTVTRGHTTPLECILASLPVYNRVKRTATGSGHRVAHMRDARQGRAFFLPSIQTRNTRLDSGDPGRLPLKESARVILGCEAKETLADERRKA